MTHPYTPLKHSWNTLEQILKHPWETLKIPVLQLFDHYIYIPHMRALEGTSPLKMFSEEIQIVITLLQKDMKIYKIKLIKDTGYYTEDRCKNCQET